MTQTSSFPGLPASEASRSDERAFGKVAQRLLAHARLCREIAARCWNEDSARKLEDMANACVHAAGTMQAAPAGHLH